MAINLYASRIIINALGIRDYGTYNAVAGGVTLLSIITGSLASAISRFFTCELAKDNYEKIQSVYNTSIQLLLLFSVVVIILGEIIGVWFLNTQMNIDAERLVAANWVLQSALFVFCVNLLSVVYRSVIIAHEKMQAFAIISIIEAISGLIVCWLVLYLHGDRLINYSLLTVCSVLLVRFVYGIYCRRNFVECQFHLRFDRKTAREMAGFTSWNIITNIAYVVNTQGTTLLMNIYYGVTFNAVRAIAEQVNSAVGQFSNSIVTAIDPQITKNIATENRGEARSLLLRGSKFAYYLCFIIALPLLIETDFILRIWLGSNIPIETIIFVRLTLIGVLINVLGRPCNTACMAVGDIKKVSLYTSALLMLCFFISWVSFGFGFVAETTYIIYIAIFPLIILVRLFYLKSYGIINIKSFALISTRAVIISLLSSVLPIIYIYNVPSTPTRSISSIFLCMVMSCLCIYMIGLSASERTLIKEYIKKKANIYSHL